MSTEEFYKVLFDEGEQTVFGYNIYETKPTVINKIGPAVKEKYQFFVINPIQKQKTRSIKGVQHFRNFMFEIDEDQNGNVVSIEKQKEIITESQLPWTTCTYSGGKSLHWIVSLAQPVDDAIQYRIWWKMMVTILNRTAKKLGHELVFDSNVKDPSRFSRAANSMRDNGKKQDLVSIRTRVTQEEVMRWFSNNEVRFEDHIPKPTKFDLSEVTGTTDDKERFEYIINVLMRNQEYVKGNMNAWQFTFARLARRTGMTQDNVRYYIQSHCGEVDHRDPIGSAYSDKYNDDEPIYVFSKEDKTKWAQRMAIEEQLAINQKKIDNGEADDLLHINGVYDYVRVGTSFYKKSKTGDLTPWDKQTMTMDFGTENVKKFPEQLKYEGFCNIVNFTEDVTNVNRMYNRFTRPQWTPSEGKWPTTEKLLRKVFSECGNDQWEEGLDWIQLQLTNPKQILHCLILGSQSREAGKDTFVEWMTMLLGEKNTYFADIENFLKPFNSAYADKCLIALNEVKFSSINDGSMEKIKQYITQDKVIIDEKFQVPVTLDYYGKMIMLTNNIHDFMRIDDEENRFWIRTMPELDKKKDFDPNFKSKLQEEIPHFVHYILNRSLNHTEKLSRFWLPESITHTVELKNIRENSKSSLYIEIYDWLDNTFFNRKDTDELFFVLNDVREGVKTDVGPKQIKMCLLKEFGMENKKMLRKNSFTQEERNSQYFSVKRSEFYEQPDSTPDLDDVFTI